MILAIRIGTVNEAIMKGSHLGLGYKWIVLNPVIALPFCPLKKMRVDAGRCNEPISEMLGRNSPDNVDGLVTVWGTGRGLRDHHITIRKEVTGVAIEAFMVLAPRLKRQHNHLERKEKTMTRQQAQRD
jgi:hypothetical protein